MVYQLPGGGEGMFPERIKWYQSADLRTTAHSDHGSDEPLLVIVRLKGFPSGQNGDSVGQ